MCTAVGLRSLPVTVQVGLAFSTGSSEEPQPQPISRKWGGGCLIVRQGNSSRRYLHAATGSVPRCHSQSFSMAWND